MVEFLKTHPARVQAVLAAAAAIVAFYVPGVPVELFVPLLLAILGAGEAAQRVENAKTAEAAETVPATADSVDAAGGVEVVDL